MHSYHEQLLHVHPVRTVGDLIGAAYSMAPVSYRLESQTRDEILVVVVVVVVLLFQAFDYARELSK